MSDIFDEVGEDLRRDRLTGLWKRYGWVLYVVAGLIVAGTAAWRGYDYWATSRANAAGDAYSQVLASVKAGDHKALAESLAVYGSGAPKQYQVLARFRAASEHAAMGEMDNALAAFEDLSKTSGVDQPLRQKVVVIPAIHFAPQRLGRTPVALAKGQEPGDQQHQT